MRTSSLFSALAFYVVASPAYAESPTASDLFNEGRELAARGDYAAACPKFERSLQLQPGIGTQYNLADCWEHRGRLASALALFQDAADAAKEAGQVEREQAILLRAESLKRRVSSLVIRTTSTSAKLTVWRNDRELPEVQWGKPQPVDAGAYRVVVESPGYLTYTRSVEVVNDGSVVTVEVPDLKPVPVESSGGPGLATAAPLVAPAGPEPAGTRETQADVAPAATSSDPPSWHEHAVLGLGGIGIGSLAFGAIMASRYGAANTDAQSICPTSRNCSSQEIAEHERLVSRSRTARTLAFVGVGVGVASLGGAAVLYVLDQRRRSTPEARLAPAPIFSADGALGAGVVGRF